MNIKSTLNFTGIVLGVLLIAVLTCIPQNNLAQLSGFASKVTKLANNPHLKAVAANEIKDSKGISLAYSDGYRLFTAKHEPLTDIPKDADRAQYQVVFLPLPSSPGYWYALQLKEETEESFLPNAYAILNVNSEKVTVTQNWQSSAGDGVELLTWLPQGVVVLADGRDFYTWRVEKGQISSQPVKSSDLLPKSFGERSYKGMLAWDKETQKLTLSTEEYSGSFELDNNTLRFSSHKLKLPGVPNLANVKVPAVPKVPSLPAATLPTAASLAAKVKSLHKDSTGKDSSRLHTMYGKATELASTQIPAIPSGVKLPQLGFASLKSTAGDSLVNKPDTLLSRLPNASNLVSFGKLPSAPKLPQIPSAALPGDLASKLPTAPNLPKVPSVGNLPSVSGKLPSLPGVPELPNVSLPSSSSKLPTSLPQLPAPASIANLAGKLPSLPKESLPGIPTLPSALPNLSSKLPSAPSLPQLPTAPKLSLPNAALPVSPSSAKVPGLSSNVPGSAGLAATPNAGVAGAQTAVINPVSAPLLNSPLSALAPPNYTTRTANIWYFGKGAGLDFNTGEAIPLEDGALDQLEGCASVADTSGRLLFYTDGSSIYNELHQKLSHNLGGDPSCTQSALILSQSEGKYLVFSLDQGGYRGPSHGLSYSTVVVIGGIPKVIGSPQKLIDGVTEKLTAVKAGKGYWLLVHKSESDAFEAFRVTEQGVNPTPVESHAGSIHPLTGNGTIGQMKFSPDAAHIALAVEETWAVELFDFDGKLGKVSNPRELAGKSVGFDSLRAIPYPYGVEFSPNGKELYVSSWRSNTLYHFSLTDSNRLFTKLINPISGEVNGALQLAPDHKIYVARYGNLGVPSHFVGVITEPDQGNGYNGHALELGLGKSTFGLPSYAASLFTPGKADFLTDGGCASQFIVFQNTSQDKAERWEWDFGDGSAEIHKANEPHAVHLYPASGVYTATLIATYSSSKDTVRRTVEVNSLGLSGGTLASAALQLPGGGAGMLLDAGSAAAGSRYAWSDGSTAQTLQASHPGTYTVTVKKGSCSQQFIYHVLPPASAADSFPVATSVPHLSVKPFVMVLPLPLRERVPTLNQLLIQRYDGKYSEQSATYWTLLPVVGLKVSLSQPIIHNLSK